MVVMIPDSLQSLSPQQHNYRSVMQCCNNYTRQGGEQHLHRPGLNGYHPLPHYCHMDLNIKCKLKQEKFSMKTAPLTDSRQSLSHSHLSCIQCTSSLFHLSSHYVLSFSTVLHLFNYRCTVAQVKTWHPVPAVKRI